MTFKNKKNLFHTIKRIKRIKRIKSIKSIKRIKSKDSRRQLSGGGPNIFTAFASSGWVGEEGKIYENDDDYIADAYHIADAFQVFIDTKNISHSLKSIKFDGYGTEKDTADEFIITAINVNKYFTPETIDKNKQIYTFKYKNFDNQILLLAYDRELLKRFMSKIMELYPGDSIHNGLLFSIVQCLRDVDEED